MKLRALALAAGLVTSSGASATVNLNLIDGTNLGNFGAPTMWSESFSVSSAGVIDHSLTFTITEDLYAGSGVFDIPLEIPFGSFTLSVLNINGLTAQIFDSTNTSYASFVQAGDADHLTLPTGTYFAVDSYTLKIGGTATGSAGAMYTIAAVTAPVPEPETWAMLLVGMGLVGLRALQKAKTSSRPALN
jgi:hypothetical protein